MALALLAGCATPPYRTAAVRDAIHARLVLCMHQADEEARLHGGGAMAGFYCQRQAREECLQQGLEASCAQWEWGGT